MTVEPSEKPNRFGIIAMAVAALALLITVIHWTAGPFNPPQPLEETVVETALKIRDAAERAMTGEPAPAPVKPAFDIDRATEIAGVALAGLAMATGLFALLKNEQRAPAFAGFSLGGAVLLMTWLQWIALILCAVIVIGFILSALGDILPS